MREVIDNGKYIALLSRLMLKFSTEQLKLIGLSGIEYSYLMILSEVEYMSQEELTRHAMVDKAQTTRAVTSLISKELATKIRCSEDKRVYHVSLTEKGKELVPAVRKEINLFESTLNKGLTLSEQKQMKKFLIKMIRNMKEGDTT